MRTLKNYPDAVLLDFKRGGRVGKALYHLKIDDNILAVVEENIHDSSRVTPNAFSYTVYESLGRFDPLPTRLSDIGLWFGFIYDYHSFWRDVMGFGIGSLCRH